MSNAPYSQGNQGRSPQSGKTIWAWVAIACIGGAILAVAAFRFFNAQDPVVAEANQAQPAPVPPPPVDFDPAEMPLDGPPLTGEPVEPLAPGDTDPSATSPPSDAGSAPASNAIPLKPIHVFGGAPLRHWDSITHLDVSPDGKYAVSIADNCRIVVWDLTTGKEVKVLAEGQGAFGRVRDTNLAGAKFSGDGTRVCTHTDKKLTMWKWPSLEVEAETKTSGEVYSLACSHDGSLVLAVMDSSDEGIVFKLDNGKFKRVRGFKDAGRHATLSPDGKFAAFPVSFDTDVFDVASGEKRIAKAPGEDLHFSSDSQRFAVIDRFTSDNATIRILDSRDGTEIEKTELADLKRVSLRGSIAFSPDLQYLAVLNSGGVHLWNIKTQERLPALKFPSPALLDLGSRAGDVAFSADGSLLVAGSTLGEIRAWKIPDGEPVFPDHNERDFFVRKVQFSPDGSRLLLASEDGELRTVDVMTGQTKASVRPQQPGLVALSRDTSRFVGRSEKGLALYDAASGEVLREFPFENKIYSMSLSLDGKLIAYVHGDPKRGSYKAETVSPHDDTRITYQESNYTIADEPGNPRLTVHAFAPDGSRIYFGNQAIDLQTRTKVDGFESDYDAAAFAPDGKTLFAITKSSLKAMDPQTGEAKYYLITNEHRNYKYFAAPAGFALSEDGSVAVAGSDFGKVHVWDLSQGVESKELKATRAYSVGPANGVIRDVALSPDGKYLATANGNGTAYLFTLPE